MAKGAKDPKPVKGKQKPLQPMVSGGKLTTDPREAPCGDNKMDKTEY
jgi:hypothetical protein